MEKLSKRELLRIAEQTASKAGEILKNSNAKVLLSVGKDIKISSDREVHEFIVEELNKTNIPILSEEDNEHEFNLNGGWVVDPLDGSMNFLRGIPLSAISIGLVKEGKPILGVVYDFNRGEMFTGIVGEGAWLNGNKISVSKIEDRSEAIVSTGFPSYTDFSKGALEEYVSLIQSFKKVRLFGSAALSLVYVACGRVDAYYERDIKIWDVTGGLAIVEASGGQRGHFKFDKRGQGTIMAAATSNLTF